MDNKKLIQDLCNLAQLDIDATHAYEEAIQHIEDIKIRAALENFKNDHFTHIDNLSSLIVEYGGTAPAMKQDFKGYLIEGFTSLRSITGTVGALKAMETNEQLTNKTYKDALTHEGLPAEVITLLEKNYSDEKRHLEYIQTTLKQLEAAI